MTMPKIRWTTQASLVMSTRRADGMHLGMFITDRDDAQWVILALETSAEGVQQVLDNHAHAVLDPQPTLTDAIALCERYGKWWLTSRAKAFDCSCKDIG